MDRSRCSSGSSSGCGCSTIPKNLLHDIKISLGTDRDIIATIKAIEKSHWDYLDNYRDYDRRRYPTLSIQQYCARVFQSKGHPINQAQVQNYIRIYNRYKKSVPTAGAILYHLQNNDIYFVVVRMRSSPVWSMPKGKQEPTEDLVHTAKREFLEETGLDLEDLITSETPCCNICRTCFYLIESDIMGVKFGGYDVREIEDVKWVNVETVMKHSIKYSKQTIAVAKQLMQQYSAERGL